MMRKLLEAMTKFAGQPEQKPGEQWKGTDKGTPGNKLVGSADESVLKDLSKGVTPKTKEQELAEEWANFNEDDLGVEEKRPHRTGSRADKVGVRGHKEQPRYTTVKDEVEETLGVGVRKIGVGVEKVGAKPNADYRPWETPKPTNSGETPPAKPVKEATAAGLKVGDHITANTSKGEYPGGHKSRAGKVTRVGQTGVHITPDDGGEVEYHPYKIVKKTVKDKDVYEGWNNGTDRVQLADSTSAYWNGTGRLQAEYDELYNQLVPASGAAETLEGEVLRAASKIVYRHFNDGDLFNKASFDQLKGYIGSVTSYDDLAEKAVEYALRAQGNYHPNAGWDSLDVMDYGPEEEEEYDDDEEDDDSWDHDDDEDLLGEGEHDAEFIDHEDNWYNMADWARAEFKKGKTVQDVIKYLRDNDYLGPQDTNNFMKTVRGEKWNESVEEGMEEFAKSQAKQRAAKRKSIPWPKEVPTDAEQERNRTRDEEENDPHPYTQVGEGAADVYSITSERNGRERSKSGTLAELIEYYGYTLETGKSYERERGNSKINLNPKSIESLVQNLNNAKDNAAANGSSNERFYVDHGNMVDEGKWFKTQYGWAGGRNEKTGGTYKHPDQIKADREAKKAATAQQSNDAFNNMLGGNAADLIRDLKIREGWESGPEERTTRERDPDAEYDARRQEKLDAEADSAPKTTAYQCVGRGPDNKANFKFGPEFATQDEAVAYRKKLMANPKTPNPRDIGIRTISKLAESEGFADMWKKNTKKKKPSDPTSGGFADMEKKNKKKVREDIESNDPLEGALLNAIQELVSQGHKDVDPMVLTNMVVAATSRPFLLKDLVDANNNSLAVQHYIDSISPSKVKFSTDTLTVKNEDPSKDKAKAQAGVSSMASRAANRSRLGEGNETPLQDKEDYNAKRAALQQIQLDPDTAKDPQLKAELARRLGSLNQQYTDLQSKLREFKESRGHKAIATKLGNMDRMNNVQIPSPAERREQLRIAKAKEEVGKKQVKEFAAPGANPAPVTNATKPVVDPAAAAKTTAATSALKAATGSTAPVGILDKAINSATQGTAVNAQDMKALAPIMGVVDAAAADPKLAGQFKTLATQAQQSLKAQQKPQ